MKKHITGLTVTVIIACSIIACAGCEKNSDSSMENTSRDELIQKAQGMLSPEDLSLFDLNWVDTSSYSNEELEQFFDSHITLFMPRAYLVFYKNEEDPMLTDVLLVPFEADFAEIINQSFTERIDMLIGFKTKSKKRLQEWVAQKTEEGYIVVTKYNKTTKEYDAAAYTRLEWALITSR